uniref:Uncharacterized protein n=1 Tax=Knipowitschia caucasica TaxID=637954 RepID=A0AAV2MM21_KNICA
MQGHLSQECLRILNLQGRKKEEPNLGRQPLPRAPNPQESKTSQQKGLGRLSKERLNPRSVTDLTTEGVEEEDQHAALQISSTEIPRNSATEGDKQDGCKERAQRSPDILAEAKPTAMVALSKGSNGGPESPNTELTAIGVA